MHPDDYAKQFNLGYDHAFEQRPIRMLSSFATAEDYRAYSHGYELAIEHQDEREREIEDAQ